MPSGAILPTTYFISLMRAIILRGATFFEYAWSLGILTAMAIAAVLCLLAALPEKDRLGAIADAHGAQIQEATASGGRRPWPPGQLSFSAHWNLRFFIA